MNSEKRPFFTEERLNYSEVGEAKDWFDGQIESNGLYATKCNERQGIAALGAAIFLALTCITSHWWQAICVFSGILLAAHFIKLTFDSSTYNIMCNDLILERDKYLRKYRESLQ